MYRKPQMKSKKSQEQDLDQDCLVVDNECVPVTNYPSREPYEDGNEPIPTQVTPPTTSPNTASEEEIPLHAVIFVIDWETSQGDNYSVQVNKARIKRSIKELKVNLRYDLIHERDAKRGDFLALYYPFTSDELYYLMVNINNKYHGAFGNVMFMDSGLYVNPYIWDQDNKLIPLSDWNKVIKKYSSSASASAKKDETLYEFSFYVHDGYIEDNLREEGKSEEEIEKAYEDAWNAVHSELRKLFGMDFYVGGDGNVESKNYIDLKDVQKVKKTIDRNDVSTNDGLVLLDSGLELNNFMLRIQGDNEYINYEDWNDMLKNKRSKESVRRKAENENEDQDVVNTFNQLDLQDRREIMGWVSLITRMADQGYRREPRMMVKELAAKLQELGFEEKRVPALIRRFGLGQYYRKSANRKAQSLEGNPEIIEDEETKVPLTSSKRRARRNVQSRSRKSRTRASATKRIKPRAMKRSDATVKNIKELTSNLK